MFLLVLAALLAIPLGLDLYMPVPEDNPVTLERVERGRALWSVLYTLPSQQGNHVISRNLTSGEETTLLQAPGNHGFSLSPDGRTVATIKNVSDDGGRWSVWVTDLASKQPREVWRPSDRRVYPGPTSWDPSGRGVYVVAEERPAAPEIWFVPVDGSTAVMTGLSMPVLGAVTVHPDGRRIGFTGGRSTDEIWSIRNLLPPSTVRKN
jgi:Tol biopolymer transport system component